jgi:heme exporter protein CcmD
MDFSSEHVNYVLLAYAVSVLVLAAITFAILRSDRKAARDLQSREKDKG